MRNKKYLIKSIAISCALLLLGVFGAPVCYAFRPPTTPITDIATLDEFTTWYRLPEAGLAMLTNDIEITQSLTLGQTTQAKGVQAYNWGTGRGYTLRVMPGATLIVDNPKMELGGVQDIITVEGGGTLLLRRGRLDAGKDISTIAIVAKNGSKVTYETGFTLNGSIKDENIVLPPETPDLPETPDSPETTPPETPVPPPDTRTPITSLFDDKAHISCVVGERPESSQYPTTVYAYFGGTDRAELAVDWGLSAVDFNKAGTYTVVGTLTDEVMQKHNLSNPKGLTARMTITVYEKGSLTDVRSEVLSVGSTGNTIARLILPALPTAGISSVYIYQSTDQCIWKKATRDLFPVNGVIPTSEDFLPAVTTVGGSSYIPFYYQTDYKPLWVRVEIVGSDRVGMSNAVQLKLPSGAAPGDKTQNDSNEDAGDSGGNRGGVGQEETERVLPPKDENAQNGAISPQGSIAGIQSGVAAKGLSGTVNPSETTGDAPEKTADIPLEEASEHEAITVMGEAELPSIEGGGSSAKPAIPTGAVTAAVCTVAVISAASVLLKCNWQAIRKLFKRKS